MWPKLPINHQHPFSPSSRVTEFWPPRRKTTCFSLAFTQRQSFLEMGREQKSGTEPPGCGFKVLNQRVRCYVAPCSSLSFRRPWGLAFGVVMIQNGTAPSLSAFYLPGREGKRCRTEPRRRLRDPKLLTLCSAAL